MSENNWYVITGGPSSGKTTLIQELARRKYATIQEAAREVIDNGLAQGKSVKEIRSDEQVFQYEVLKQKLAVEASHDNQILTFFDRGMHDTAAYLQYYGWELNVLAQQAMKSATYRKVFLLEPLPNFEKDYARTEEDGFAESISRLLYDTYSAYNLKPIRVPALDVKDRLDFIVARTT